MAACGVNPSARARLGALIRRRTTHRAAASPRAWFAFIKVAVARIVVDSDAEATFNIHVVGRSVTRIRATQTAAGHAARRGALHVLIPRAGTRATMGFIGVPFVRPQARSLTISPLLRTYATYHFVAVWHDCTRYSSLSPGQIALFQLLYMQPLYQRK